MDFIEEIYQQPEALRKLNEIYSKDYAPLKNIAGKGLKNTKTIFTGMGSSLFAGYIACSILNNEGIEAIAVESNELNKTKLKLIDKNTIVIAISQSGGSPEVISFCESCGTKKDFVVVTNNVTKQLYTFGNTKFEIYAGSELRTATKTYTNTVAAIIYIAYALMDKFENLPYISETIKKCADRQEDFLKNKTMIEDLCDFFVDCSYICVVGSGLSYASASHAQLLVEEAGKKFSTRYTTAQFLHGPIELINADFSTLIFDTDPRFHTDVDRIIDNVLTYGGRIGLITSRSMEQKDNLLVVKLECDDYTFSPLTEIIPVELMIDAVGNKLGIKPGYISRVKK